MHFKNGAKSETDGSGRQNHRQRRPEAIIKKFFEKLTQAAVE
jgi:hypothetical protein